MDTTSQSLGVICFAVDWEQTFISASSVQAAPNRVVMFNHLTAVKQVCLLGTQYLCWGYQTLIKITCFQSGNEQDIPSPLRLLFPDTHDHCSAPTYLRHSWIHLTLGMWLTHLSLGAKLAWVSCTAKKGRRRDMRYDGLNCWLEGFIPPQSLLQLQSWG